MTINVDDILEVTVEHQLGPEHSLNVTHYQVGAVTEPSEDTFLKQVNADLLQEWEGLNASYMGEGAQVVCITSQRISITNPTRIYTEFSAAAPSSRDPANTASASILLSKYPDAGSDPKNGRMFYPFPASEFSEEGQIDESVIVTMLADFKKILLDPVVLTAAVGTILPAIAKKVPLVEPVASLITDLILRPVLASQKRRVDHHQNFVTIGP